MKAKFRVILSIIIIHIIPSYLFCQSYSNILKEMYDGAYGVVEEADDLTTIAVESVWLASSITGVATFTGTLTQNPANPNYFTYSYSPSDKLVIHFANGSEIYFKFYSFDGYTEGDSEDFLNSHAIDFNAEISGSLNIRIKSNAGPNGDLIEYNKTITGTSLYDGSQLTVNLTTSGNKNVTVSGGFAFGDYNAQSSGTISSDGIDYTVNESYTTYIGFNSGAGMYVQERHIKSNNSASGNFGSFKFENLYCHYIGGTAFADSANMGVYNQALETDKWAAEGQLMKNNQFFGNIQFDIAPISGTYGSKLIARCQDGNDYLLDKLLMWYITDVRENKEIADNFTLYQNYPNPFNPETTIEFSLPFNSLVELDVYDILGRKINSLIKEELPAGLHRINFNAGNLSSGTYFYRIKAGKYYSIKKMILMK